jgi:hypothetical protein
VPKATLDGKSGEITGLAVEEHLKRIREQLLPLLDRANKMMIRNLKAVRNSGEVQRRVSRRAGGTG